MRNVLLIIALGTAIAALVISLVTSSRLGALEASSPQAARSGGPAGRPETDRDALRIRALERRVGALEAAAPDRRGAGVRGDDPKPGADGTGGSPLKIPDLFKDSGERPNRRAEELSARMQGEPLDRAWAGATRRAIAERFAAGGYDGASIEDISCRATICSIRMVFRDVEAQGVFFERFATEFPMKEMAFRPAADGSGSDYRGEVILLVR